MPIGKLLYPIFRSREDDQREALNSQQTYTNEGVTWHIRMLKLKFTMYVVAAILITFLVVSVGDYMLYIYTEEEGVLGLMFEWLFGEGD